MLSEFSSFTLYPVIMTNGIIESNNGISFSQSFRSADVFSSSVIISASISVLELKLLANSRSDVSKLFLRFVLELMGTLPFSSLIKVPVRLSSRLGWPCEFLPVMCPVFMVSGTMLSSAGTFPGVSRGEPGLVWSPVVFGLPLPKVLLFSVALVVGSGVLGLSVSICGASASDSFSDSIMTARFCFNGDFVKRPSGPLGPVPLLLYSFLKVICLLMFFL